MIPKHIDADSEPDTDSDAVKIIPCMSNSAIEGMI